MQAKQHQHHAHCSYENDIVCDEAQSHQQKYQHHAHQHIHNQQCEQRKSTSTENVEQQQSQRQQQQHHLHHSKQQLQNQSSAYTNRHHHHQQLQRKHSHSHSPHHSRHTSPHSHHTSPHSRHTSPHSRHTSPHSHHSHSLHSSPHQSHQHIGGSTGGGSGNLEPPFSPTRPTNHHIHRSNASASASGSAQMSHAHHHHHHRRRSRRNQNQHGTGNGNSGGSNGGSGNSSFHGPHDHTHNSHNRSSLKQHSTSCSRRHRSATDISSASLNTCHDTCADREVQEIFVRKSCCSSSRTELAQFFAEDLYGSSRRPSSCCTSSDYCYQTDSTSLYGSRSSLSHNNSIKSASVAMRKRRALQQRQPSYTSISLRGLQSNRPGSHYQDLDVLSGGFDRQRSKSTGAEHDKIFGCGKIVLSPSKVTIERHTSKDALSQELPDYACSPSPIRWSFLADEKPPSTEDASKNDVQHQHGTQPKKPCRQSKSGHTSVVETTSAATITPSTTRKRRGSHFSCEFEESSTTVLFHQEGEAYNNCCNNYVQCNTYLDQDLQITSEDIHQYLSKGHRNSDDILNNSKNYPFQPSNALEFHYKNNFANNNAPTGTATNTTAESSEGGDSMRGTNRSKYNNSRFQRNSSKETNLNQNSGDMSGECTMESTYPNAPISTANINLSSSTNNINIIFNTATTSIAGMERNSNEVKFINTSSCSGTTSGATHHSSYMQYSSPTYNYTNMSSNSFFNKPLGIDELPKEFDTGGAQKETSEETSSDGQHSSPLLSPVQTGVSFESFDAPSDHNLISQRGSCQYSSPTTRSPLSPTSPTCSSISASVNPAAASYVLESTHHHARNYEYHSFEQEQQEQHQQQQHQAEHHHRHHHHHHHHSPASTSTSHRTHHAHHSHQAAVDNHQHHHTGEDSFKLSNAFKKVRKRARKYTGFLRKK